MRDKTFGEDLQQVRTGSQPNAYAAIRNLVTGEFRRAGFANTAHARRYDGRDDKRILALYGYAETDIKTSGSHNTNTPGPWVGDGLYLTASRNYPLRAPTSWPFRCPGLSA